MAPNQAASWLGIPLNHPFGLETLPYGSFSTSDRPGELRAGVGLQLAIIAASYGLDIEDDLASTLPEPEAR